MSERGRLLSFSITHAWQILFISTVCSASAWIWPSSSACDRHPSSYWSQYLGHQHCNKTDIYISGENIDIKEQCIGLFRFWAFWASPLWGVRIYSGFTWIHMASHPRPKAWLRFQSYMEGPRQYLRSISTAEPRSPWRSARSVSSEPRSWKLRKLRKLWKLWKLWACYTFGNKKNSWIHRKLKVAPYNILCNNLKDIMQQSAKPSATMLQLPANDIGCHPYSAPGRQNREGTRSHSPYLSMRCHVCP